jgi:hypothetical protein
LRGEKGEPGIGGIGRGHVFGERDYYGSRQGKELISIIITVITIQFDK